MNKNIVVILGVIFLVGAWFLAAPLFIDETVDESFDAVPGEGQCADAVVSDCPIAQDDE